MSNSTGNSTMSHQQTLLALTEACHAYVPGYDPSYGYIPSMAAGITFCVLFGLSMFIHTGQAIWTKRWWCLVFALGALTEVLGWAGRTWSADCPYNGTAFLMQISTLIIAPVFFTAGIYIILGRFLQILGQEYSFMKPTWYLWIFCTCDVLSLVIQAIGGGMASGQANSPNGNTKPGTDIMVAGIIFQLASITVFVYCMIDFLYRLRVAPREKRLSIRPLLLAMTISVVVIYIRSIYRTIELLQGWSGYLITHERYFIALDGAMMVIAVGVFNVLHPGWLLPKQSDVMVGPEDEQIPMEESGKGSEAESAC
ncbi:RTA1-domain-containing protein [Xylona heveae TC161]|uniref:RTA1-domain-containing protein n=1 Tax=Xylona heveae (strain CBS 132557 / TC161) TaxID=1328760 RepID=A0A161TB75_XYLHT|nr:RTA1-domain-containing protein [Xylona heveae TC161]KZF22887.1 RTA1-domain-containing protein [Xylona heveae TC161]